MHHTTRPTSPGTGSAGDTDSDELIEQLDEEALLGGGPSPSDPSAEAFDLEPPY
ncbi:hypothetical protein [uncultured Pseudonocardia sp.]|uniref:hypothetical protein n=1 Tax=uncultured Pseudonocardia sp. TaxID=211455 RepID=UPI002638043D|nr:hypothetical protein [uncultured Pseudonocardia sp.]